MRKIAQVKHIATSPGLKGLRNSEAAEILNYGREKKSDARRGRGQI